MSFKIECLLKFLKAQSIKKLNNFHEVKSSGYEIKIFQFRFKIYLYFRYKFKFNMNLN